jgi:glyoxylase-like metal-dependent hydrolase (beta-lactamase superfamily II)
MRAGGWTIEILIQGYPGKATVHGGLGWSTVVLLRGHGHVAVLDTGNFGARKVLVQELAARGLAPNDVTDLILSHLHYDHIVNWPMFSRARIITGARELAWALEEPPGTTPVAEFYVQALKDHPRLATVEEGDTVLPGITAHLAPGHTPGHLIFLVQGAESDVILVQDAAKYRCELLTRTADMTYDPTVTAATIGRIWSMWRRKPGTIVLTGHDLPLVLENGTPAYRGERKAGIAAFMGATMQERTIFDLSAA